MKRPLDVHPIFQTARGVRYPIAGKMKRITAFVIDVLLFLSLFQLAVKLKPDLPLYAPFVLVLLYFVFLPVFLGTTPGKKMMGIRVLRADNHEEPSFGSSVQREFLGFLGLVLHVWIIFDPKGQGVHDRISGTVVVEFD